MPIAVVWLKRDLRLSDHAPLLEAINSGLPVLLLYCFEPIVVNDKHTSARHLQFINQSLQDIQHRVPQGALRCSLDNVTETLTDLHQQFGISALYSHQEVGLNSTFERDIEVGQWCEIQGIDWHETPYAAVIRGLSDRQNWDKHWQKVMRAPLANIDLSVIDWLIDDEAKGSLSRCAASLPNAIGTFQYGGEQSAWQTLTSFFEGRGQSYAYSLSSPLLSQTHCSRLSAYLAWGNISLRQVYQQLLQHWNTKGWRRSLVALSSRLHWHCHFIQKFESESAMEFRPVNRGYIDLPRAEGVAAMLKLEAWKTGKTGIPMVDACMRCLIHTGYINFRMRAMLVSFLTHHLQLDWRLGVQHLAQLFLDFEPGIHYSQFQMQAGVTGINTIRIYNPVKQGIEKDSDGEFVKKWLPELEDIPAPLVHSPWMLSPMEQMMHQVQLGIEYPEPIVDLSQSYKAAQSLLWQWRSRPQVKQEAQRLLQRHVRQG